ncbi:unnamed protein product [Pedinophyceae sp. YPF-701]|nr:unnamed protein product [Pedinophyceae sp. YPF-701]
MARNKRTPVKKRAHRASRELSNHEASGGVKEPRRYRYAPGTKPIREIRKWSTGLLLIPKEAFARLVREISDRWERTPERVRWTEQALRALQEAAEAAMVGLFEVANLFAIHDKRETITPMDIQLARRITEAATTTGAVTTTGVTGAAREDASDVPPRAPPGDL